jgi:hypothetical protein
MVLHAAGADIGWLPDVGFIECLTTLPFGNLLILGPDGALPLFSSATAHPEDGLRNALAALGWECDESRGGDDEAALGRLQAALRFGPALVGPLDLGYLDHTPRNRGAVGADHFVVAQDLEAGQVRFHDPAGFPHATLPAASFMRAWRAERVAYAASGYALRSNLRRKNVVSRGEMIARTLPLARAGLTADPGGPQRFGSVRALEMCAELLRVDVPPPLASHLVGFALPLAARRRSDAAAFMDEAGNARAASLLADEARAFGAAQYPAAQGLWVPVADLIRQVAQLERALIDSV